MDILRVENLCKVYGKGDTAVRALDNVSFTIQKGDFVAIVGPSGSGKSTLLHILGGVDTPSSGKVYIDNIDVYSLSETNLAIFRRRQIGLIYQFYNLVPGAERGGKHHPAPAAGRPEGGSQAAQRPDRHPGPAAAGWATCPTSFPAGSSSGSPSAGR